jgi:serine/threonine protein kinase
MRQGTGPSAPANQPDQPAISRVSDSEDLTTLLDEIAMGLPDLVCTIHNFNLQEEIGKGGFGRVLRATDKRTGKVVAVKEVFASRIEGHRFRRYILEIETMVHLLSPYIVPICGFSTRPTYCIVSTFMTNGALSKWTHPRKDVPVQPLTPTQNIIIALGVAYGLQLMHSLHILHRDLKCANILLDEDLYPRICDLGIARFEDDGVGPGMTMNLGTPSYMAPELMGEGSYTAMVDIYSYGAALFEMAERRRVLKGIRNIQDLYRRVFLGNEKPKFSDRSSVPLRKLVRKCMSREPSDRFTATEVIAYIKAHVADLFPGTKQSLVSKYERWAEKSFRAQTKARRISRPAHIFDGRRKAADAKPLRPVNLEESLKDPVGATFGSDLLWVAEQMPLEQLPVVVPIMLTYFRSPNATSLQILLMEVVNQIMARAPPAVGILAHAGFFLAMPVTRATIVRALDFTLDMVTHAPHKMTPDFQSQFVKMIEIRPDQGLTVLEFCVRRHFPLRSAGWF